MLITREKMVPLMDAALALAREASAHGDVPVGALVIDEKGAVIGRGKNEREKQNQAHAHAESLAIAEACAQRKNWNLTGCHLIVTLEPCLMCTGLITLSRIEKVWFGADDPKGGALVSTYTISKDNRTNHALLVEGGIRAAESSALLKDFFKKLR